MADDPVTRRYLDDAYREHNPTWDAEDSPWKAALVRDAIQRLGLHPVSIAEVGCGAGGVLAALRGYFPKARLAGFDIAPAAARFWAQHAAAGIEFRLGDFLETNGQQFDLLLLLDVVEHLANPFDFLARIRSGAAHFVFHIPLDLSALAVLRESPLLQVREKVGHIHFFTKRLALALLEDCGYDILDWRYTGATFVAPRRTWKTRLAGLVRRLAYAVDRDAGVRLLGGETLIVVARPRAA